MAEERKKSYRQLEKRIAREKQLLVAQQKMEIKKMLRVRITKLLTRRFDDCKNFECFISRANRVRSQSEFRPVQRLRRQFTNGKRRENDRFYIIFFLGMYV